MNLYEKYAQIVGKDKVNELRAQGEIIAQIIEERTKRNMSQQALADAIKVSKSTIARIESGVMFPDEKTLQRIAIVFTEGLSPDFYEGLEGAFEQYGEALENLAKRSEIERRNKQPDGVDDEFKRDVEEICNEYDQIFKNLKDR